MDARILLLSVVAVLMAVGSYPEISRAQENAPKSPTSSKRKSNSKKASAKSQPELDTDPYGNEEEASKTDAPGASTTDKASEELSEADRPAEGAAGEGSLRRSNRMEFDERLVKGQAAKSGAVYLFKRTPRRLPGLVPMRRSYRSRIVRPVLGDRELKPIVSHTQDKDKPRKKAKKVEIVKPPVETKVVDESDKTEEEQAPPTKNKKRKKKKRNRGGDK